MSKTEVRENSSWLIQRWHALMREHGLDPAARVRKARVLRLEVLPGRVVAQVTGREQGTYDVELRWPPLNSEEWTKVVDALSGQALYAAQLLAGNFPPAVEEIFAEVDLALLPGRLDEWRIIRSPVTQTSVVTDTDSGPTSLTAPIAVAEDSAVAQDTAAAHELTAICQMLGQIFVDDPWLVFQLRGRNRQQLLQALREHRAQHVHESDMLAASVPVAPRRRNSVLRIDGDEGKPILERSPDLSEPGTLHDFGGFELRFKELHHHIQPPVVDLALLRRLGPPSFVPHGTEAYEALAHTYEQVSKRALALAYAAAPE